jgi:uncharacterized protein (DUF697 family)
MHDIDRALFEMESGGPGTYESEAESQMYEMEEAARLFEIKDEEELEQFLGDLLSSAAGAVKTFVNSDAGRAVGGILKSAAKQALPQLGRAVGDAISPGFGASLGSVGSYLGSRLEVEGLSHEDKEFETARAFVRFAKDAMRRAIATPASVPPAQAALHAATAAAHHHLPELVSVVQRMRPQTQGLGSSATHGFAATSAPSHAEMEEEYAHGLLGVANEEELEEFLGDLVSSAIGGVKSFVNSGVGRAIGGVLKSVAKTALPAVGSALGSFIAPGLGIAIGGKLGSYASGLLELEEAQMLGAQEAELEAARRYVRFAQSAVRNAYRAPTNLPPNIVARRAAIAAAQQYAPGLLRPQPTTYRGGWRTRRPRRNYWSPAYRPGTYASQFPVWTTPQPVEPWSAAPPPWSDGGAASWAGGDAPDWSSPDPGAGDPFAGAGYDEPGPAFG